MCVSPVNIRFKGKALRHRLALGLTSGVVVPCGSCSECLKKKATSWGIRAYKESLFVDPASIRFVTITYDDAHLPVCESGLPSLSSADCKQFIRSFRQSIFRKFGVQIRFLAAGEYGSKTFRPHYHFLFFGLPNISNVELKEIISSAWHKCSIIDVQFPKNASSSGFYIGKYMSKNHLRECREIHRVDPTFEMPFKRASIGFGHQFSKQELDYYLAVDLAHKPKPYFSPALAVQTFKIGDLFCDCNDVPRVCSQVDTSDSNYLFIPPKSDDIKDFEPIPEGRLAYWNKHIQGVSTAALALDVYKDYPRFMAIVQRFHECHRPTKKGGFVNIDFPEYLAKKLYGDTLYKQIKLCINSIYQRTEEIYIDPASMLFDKNSYASKKYPDFLRFSRLHPDYDFDTYLTLEYERERSSSLVLRQSREYVNALELYRNDVF